MKIFLINTVRRKHVVKVCVCEMMRCRACVTDMCMLERERERDIFRSHWDSQLQNEHALTPATSTNNKILCITELIKMLSLAPPYAFQHAN